MVTVLSKKKSKASKKAEPKRGGFRSCMTWFVYPLPTALFFMILIFIWSSSTTYISGRIVHVCISSRKLTNLYCLSATTHPNEKFQLPFTNSSSVLEEKLVVENPTPFVDKRVGNDVVKDHKGEPEEVPNLALENHNPHDKDNGGIKKEREVVENPTPYVDKRVGNDVMSDLKGESKEVSNLVPENQNPQNEDNGEIKKEREVVENPIPFVDKRVGNDVIKSEEVPNLALENHNPHDKDNGEIKKEREVVENPTAYVDKRVGNDVMSDLKGESKEVSNLVPENQNPRNEDNGEIKKEREVVENPIPFVDKRVGNDVIKSEEVSNLVLENHNPLDKDNGEIKKVSEVVENPTPDKTVGNEVTTHLKGESEEVSKFLLENHYLLNDDNHEIKRARQVVEENLQAQRSWAATQNWNRNQNQCDGRGIYVYELPPKFNKDLVAQCHDMVPWVDMCKYFSNNAFGEPIPELGNQWFRTHQYSLELIFHSRVLKHPCRVYDENQAKMFYVPYYGGLDILRWHFKNVSYEVKDTLSFELVNWLQMQKPWDKNLGKDHVFVLGKISWDFRRKDYTTWGTRFLELKEMQNPLKLMIERQPWELNDIGIPHPTHFHPQSDNDIRAWQRKIISSHRRSLISFAGAARPGAHDNIRSILIDQCTSTTEEQCKFFDCKSKHCDEPKSLIGLFTESEFCLQPPGDSPTRKSVFDSLVSGCIPVLFDPFTAYYQYPWHLPEDHGKYSVFINQEEVRKMKVNVVERLMKVPLKERDDMRRNIVYELMPKLVYGDEDAKFELFQDAFSLTMNNLMERIKSLNLE